jgi:hypothetical protein
MLQYMCTAASPAAVNKLGSDEYVDIGHTTYLAEVQAGFLTIHLPPASVVIAVCFPDQGSWNYIPGY